MGVSTNAILAFGFDIGEELPKEFIDEEDGFDWEEWVLRERNVHYEQDGDYAVYSANRTAAKASFLVEIEKHCSHSDPMYFLAARGTIQRARRGYPEEIQTHEMSEEQIAAMKQFCEDHAIEWQEPKWRIFSLWGAMMITDSERMNYIETHPGWLKKITVFPPRWVFADPALQ